MLVVAGLAFDIDATTEDEAETKLLDYLSDIHYELDILKIWVSARQDDKQRIADLEAKERINRQFLL